MKHLFKSAIVMFLLATCIYAGCSKPAVVNNDNGNTQPPPPPPPPPPLPAVCTDQSLINVKLVPVGSLSIGRIGLVSAAAGSKILFAGGIAPGAYSSRVDIYDTSSKVWTTAELSIPERQGMVAAAVGHKILFAGGQDADWTDVTSRVDIYDASNNSWTIAELSEPRAYLAAITVGDKIYFAGGANWGPNLFTGSSVVDIYDNSTNTWSTTQLSAGRYELTATSLGNKIYFAGGIHNIFSISKVIDIYDVNTKQWTNSFLFEPKTGHASFAFQNKIIHAGGAITSYWNGYTLSKIAEIKDINADTSSLHCFSPNAHFQAVLKNDHILFFTGGLNGQNPNAGTHFEIYNITTGKWSTGVLNRAINNAAIIAVNNTVYVAGGRNHAGGPYFKEVWQLEF